MRPGTNIRWFERKKTAEDINEAIKRRGESNLLEPQVGKPFYTDEYCQIYCGDARKYVGCFKPELILTDPPYPNNANHFIEGIEAAKSVLRDEACEQLLIFWDEMEMPITGRPIVAKHIWHRTNTNRPDNYEMIYHFNIDYKKRASRVLPYPVIYPGLTGCIEATGHPTQKNYKLLMELITMSKCKGLIYDPFMGSGSTLFAAKRLGLKAIGVEIEERWCEVAATRLMQTQLNLE